MSLGSLGNDHLLLSYMPPFNWQAMLAFLRLRAIPGVEKVTENSYHRTIQVNNQAGWINVTHSKSKRALLLTSNFSKPAERTVIVERVRGIFDLDADMPLIYDTLTSDPKLKLSIQSCPGVRLPGAWDPFELAVRAVLGQQISVKAAGTVAGRIASRIGRPLQAQNPGDLTHVFPSAHELAKADLNGLGLTQKRFATLKNLAKAVLEGTARLEISHNLEDFVEEWTRLPGIGEWTAHYIAMRGLGEPDAFPAGDLGLVKALSDGDRRMTRKQILHRAESWRPWRAYAAIYLWSGLST